MSPYQKGQNCEITKDFSQILTLGFSQNIATRNSLVSASSKRIGCSQDSGSWIGSGLRASNRSWTMGGACAQGRRVRLRGGGKSISPRAANFKSSVRAAMSLIWPAALRQFQSWQR